MKNIEKTPCGHYSVRINRLKKRINLGTFNTLEEAIKVRDSFFEKEKGMFLSQPDSHGKPVINIIGKEYGKLTVIEYAGKTKQKNEHRWRCKCRCGNIIVVRSTGLKGNNTKSCGCLKREVGFKRFAKQYAEASFNRVFGFYKKNAQRKNLEFSLSKDQFKEITSKNCIYCGTPPFNFFKRENDNGHYIYNGIDRKDNNKGYTVENSLTCCTICNRAKSDMQLNSFTDYLKRVAIFNRKNDNES